MVRRLRRTLTTLVLAAALLPMGAAAVPADTASTLDQADLERAEIMRLLNSDSVADQERAIRLIGHYAHTDQYDEDFYRLMVTPLQYVVVNGKTESLRIMAVSALYSIGTDAAMTGLQDQVDAIDSDRVQRVARHALAQHKADRIAAAQRPMSE